MHRATTLATKSAAAAQETVAPIPAMNGLARSCYKHLLKEAAFFDERPLAKSLLSASPFLRKDAAWSSLVYPEVQKPSPSTPSSKKAPAKTKAVTPGVQAGSSEFVRPPHGLTANTLAVPTTKNSLKNFVRQEFRKPAVDGQAFDIQRYFACMRRLELAKKLHTSCTEEVAPELPAVTPGLKQTNVVSCLAPQAAAAAATPAAKKAKKVTKKSASPAAEPTVADLKPGTMLLAHPVLVDDFTQASVLVTTVDRDEGVTGLTLNVPYVPLHMVMSSSASAESTLRQRFPELWSKKIKPSNQAFFNDWTVYSGGSLACAPLLVHNSQDLAKGIRKLNASVNSGKKGGKSKIVEVDPAYAVQLPSGWWVHALSDIMMLDPALVQNSVDEKHNARVVMNYSGWSEEQLLEEVCQNWWIQTEATSTCRALESLFQTVEITPACSSTTTASSSTASSSFGLSSSPESDLEAAIAEAKKANAPEAASISEAEDEDDKQYGTPSNYMWQRAIANLGGDLKDFARLKVVEEEEGDYRRMITSTFKDDLPASVDSAEDNQGEVEVEEKQE